MEFFSLVGLEKMFGIFARKNSKKKIVVKRTNSNSKQLVPLSHSHSARNFKFNCHTLARMAILPEVLRMKVSTLCLWGGGNVGEEISLGSDGNGMHL